MPFSTYINDRALSNYPFVDGVSLPFPRNIFRQIQLEQPRDVLTGKILTTEPVRIRSVDIRNSKVSVSFSNGIRGTAEGSNAYGSLYDSANRLCGRFLLGTVPSELTLRTETDIRLHPSCIAELYGTDTCKNGITAEINDIPYTITDVLKLSFEGDSVVDIDSFESMYGVSAAYTVSCPELTIDESRVGKPIVASMVTGVSVDKTEMLINPHYDDDYDTVLVIKVTVPFISSVIAQDELLHLVLNSVSDCKACFNTPET